MICMIWLCVCVRYWPGRGSVSLALIDCLIYFTIKPMAVSTFSAHAVGELLCGSQPTATTCVLWSVRLKGHSHRGSGWGGTKVSCQLNFRLFVSCQLNFGPFVSCQLNGC